MPRWNQYRIGTAREVHALQAAAEFCRTEGLPFAEDLESLHNKICAPKYVAAKMSYAQVVRLQNALVEAAAGKVAPVGDRGGDAYWVIVAQRLAGYKATEAEAVKIGNYLAAQRWLTSPMTIDQVARGWPTYLVRAEAAPPQGSAVERPDFSGES